MRQRQHSQSVSCPGRTTARARGKCPVSRLRRVAGGDGAPVERGGAHAPRNPTCQPLTRGTHTGGLPVGPQVIVLHALAVFFCISEVPPDRRYGKILRPCEAEGKRHSYPSTMEIFPTGSRGLNPIQDPLWGSQAGRPCCARIPGYCECFTLIWTLCWQ